MAELSESEIIAKINTIDTNIALITADLTSTGGAHLTDHTVGNKSVNGSQKLEQLLKAREIYQKLLDTFPKTIARNHDYTIDPLTGANKTEHIGDD